MSASLLIKKAAAEGVSVKLESDNKLKACGPAEARAKWLPVLREHKSELLAELAASDRKTARPQLRQGGESLRTYDGAPVLTYDPARLQAQADRRNREAANRWETDRFCSCGRLAALAWLDDHGRDVWRCVECTPTWGRA
jgi:hypothetical protein